MARTNATASASRTPAKKTVAKKSSAPGHPRYKDMISEAIKTLKERDGSSRQAIKKFILGKFRVKDNFDYQFNQALRRGVANGDFVQPKGPSGTVKLAMKAAIKKSAAPKKDPEAKKAAASSKKAAASPKKAVASPKKAAASPKKAAATPKKAAAPKKAASSKKAPAVLTKTKSGRVTKATAAQKKRATPKKAAARAALK